MSKQNLAVIFGGQSSEHEISCMSASNIIQCIDAQRYNIILVGITKAEMMTVRFICIGAPGASTKASVAEQVS